MISNVNFDLNDNSIMTMFQIWFVPTELGKKFGWKEEVCEDGQIYTQDEANLAAWEMMGQKPDPGEDDFFYCEVRPVTEWVWS